MQFWYMLPTQISLENITPHEINPVTEGQILGFHTEVLRIGKLRDRKENTGGLQAGRKELWSNDDRISVGDDEEVLSKGSGDGYAQRECDQCHRMVHFQTVQIRKYCVMCI